MSADGTSWLIVERGAALWAIPRRCLRSLERGPALTLHSGETIAVDAVHAVVRDFRHQPVRPPIARLLPDPVVGLGMWEGRPVALLDPDRRLPNCFLTPTESEKEVS